MKYSLCARLLADGANPRQFEWVKTIFPLFREASLFQLPRSLQSLPVWQPFAFFAGRKFGQTWPEKGTALIESVESELDPLGTLGRLRDALGPTEANPWNLHDAFNRLMTGEKFNDLDGAFIRYTCQSFAAGLATATTALRQPDQVPFLARIHPRIRELRTQLHIRVLMNSCTDAERQPVLKQLQHPLLKVAATKYPRTPAERDAILPFFHEQLRAFGVKSENECPASDLDLVEWVDSATEYGRRLLKDNPERVKRVTRQLGRVEVKSIADVAEDVLRRARSRSALDVTRAILKWHEAVYRLTRPTYYGQELDRVVNCADFAIWAAWIISPK